MRTLNIPYVSQIDEGRPINDCGPASALMVARAYGLARDTSIDALYRQYGWPDTGLAVSTIASLLEEIGVAVVVSRGGGGLNKLRAFIEAGFPPILLVDWYGGHFMVGTAWVEGGFLVHDSNRRGDEGKNIYVPDDDMETIWEPHGQYNYTAIVPKTPLATGENDVVDKDAVLAEINKAHAALTAAAALLEANAPAPEPEYVTLTRQFNFRKHPNTSGGTWGLMPSGTTFEKIGVVTGEYYNGSTVWYRLRNAAGIEGYAHELGFS